jgi:outer membrane protein, heavy metal efflux system
MRVLALFLAAIPLAQASDLRDLIDQALRNNPEILAARKMLEAARQKPPQASSLPDPMLSAGYVSIGGPLPGQGLGSEPMARIGFMASQMIPAPGKRRLRGAIAWKEASEAEQQYFAAQLAVVARVKAAWHELAYAHEELSVVERSRALLERLLKVSEARYATGEGSQADLLKAQTQLTLFETRAERARLAADSRSAALNALAARPLDMPIARPAQPPVSEMVVSLDTLYEQARAFAPVLLQRKHAVEKTELAMNLARKEGAIDYTVGGGYASMGRMDGRWGNMYEARVDINLPFFTRARQRAAVAEQAHERDRARREYQAAGNDLLFRIKDDALLSATSWRLLRLYESTLIPQAALTLEASLPAYETGQVDFSMLLASLMAVLDYELEYHRERLTYHLSLIRLEEATGLELIEE